MPPSGVGLLPSSTGASSSDAGLQVSTPRRVSRTPSCGTSWNGQHPDPRRSANLTLIQVGTVSVGRAGLEVVRTGRESVRSVSFPAELLDAVTHHLEHFAAPGHDGHVFVGPQGGQLRRSNFRDDWVKARKAAGVTTELHFHDLRQTGNTPASTAGASTRELMTRMGHGSSRAALIHQHMTSDRLGAMIRGGGGGASG
ncbi:tyrosine-type recombinase/integrase [Streptomyces sp. G35A]